jgi:DNA processing protein
MQTFRWQNRMADPDLDKLRLARTEGVGPIAYRRLIGRFGSAAAALRELPRLAAAGGRASPPRTPSAADAAREREAVLRLGGTLIYLGDAAYPPALAATEDAPPVLAVRGDPALLSRRSVAIVGSRNASANARRLAENFGADLAAAGLVVVSGLARGVDAAAHVGALGTGATIACIAGGLDVAYPRENADLQARIAAHGAIVAEMPPGTQPQARHFPRRNRIIAGLTLGCLVVEAAPQSGSLITARLAAEAGREVFAVPGSPLDERARGANGLIRDGAHLVECAEDVIALLPSEAGMPVRQASLGFAAPEIAYEAPTSVRDALLALLSPAPTDVDDLIRHCHVPAPLVVSLLLELELAGRLETLPGGRVALIAGAG